MAEPQFSSPAQPPMGLPGEFAAAGARQVHVIILEPGDRVLLRTGGMTEGAAAAVRRARELQLLAAVRSEHYVRRARTR